MKHGAKRKLCFIENCTDGAVKNYVCVKHGAKVKPPPCCSVKNCTKQAIKNSLCIKHGGKL